MIKIDHKSIDTVLEGASRDLVEKAMEVMRAPGRTIVQLAKYNLMTRLPAAATSNPKYKDTLIHAIKYGTHDEGNDIRTTVHVLGTKETGSGTFRTRFFEGGTKTRVTSRGNRGSIKALNFFGDAVNTLSSKVVPIMQMEFDKLMSEK